MKKTSLLGLLCLCTKWRQNSCFSDLSILTVSLCVTWFHCLCHGLTVGFSFLMVLQNLIGFCLKKLTLLWKNKHRHHIQMQLRNCMIKNNMISMISSMIKNNKTSSRSSLSLSWALLFILLVKTYIVNPFHWKPPSDLLKRAKNFTTEYNRQHFSKKILRPWSSFP